MVKIKAKCNINDILAPKTVQMSEAEQLYQEHRALNFRMKRKNHLLKLFLEGEASK